MGDLIKGRFPNVEATHELTDYDGPAGDIVIIGDNVGEVRRNKIARGLDRVEKETQQDLVYALGKALYELWKIEEDETRNAVEVKALKEEIRILKDYMDLPEIELAEMVARLYPFSEGTTDPPPAA